MKKGQVSMEFFVVIGLILIIFVVTIAFSSSRRADVEKTKNSLEAMDECLKFSSLINAVYIGGDGTQIETRANRLISFYNDGSIKVRGAKNVSEADCIFYADVPLSCNITGNFLIKNSGDKIIIENVI